mmetsp:Transcript_27386/g.80220  ORF Transcript_27386/g.80220 Transcript_27386/m.80220 type:complete len:335 (+) Transcript_27386:1-1005(+)|eukprot:4554180-Prymnesium_polylepis.2
MILVVGVVGGSACTPAPHTAGLVQRNITISDPLFGPVNRTYFLNVPSSANTGTLVVGFHGQGTKAQDWANSHTFQLLAPKWVFAYPQGMSDVGTASYDSGWNLNTNGDNSTCLAGTTGTGCHASCRSLGLCGRCSWSSCYDDKLFVLEMIRVLQDEFCLARSRIVAAGESNGAMFLHELTDTYPHLFRAVVPVFGLPLLGYSTGLHFNLLASAGARRPWVMQLHDRNDTTIPWQGGASAAGWLYEPLARTLGKWAAVHGCAEAAVPDPSRRVNGSAPDPATHMRCYSHPNCTDGAQVAHCMYDGEHGDWPTQPNADTLVVQFFVDAMRGNGSLR